LENTTSHLNNAGKETEIIFITITLHLNNTFLIIFFKLCHAYFFTKIKKLSDININFKLLLQRQNGILIAEITENYYIISIQFSRRYFSEEF
jgi:hypothetical protein